jgi:hypothetical protein
MAGLGPAIHVFVSKESKTWITGTSPVMTAGKLYPSPLSLAKAPFTARAQPFSFFSRVAAPMAGLKRRSSRQLSANFAGSG